MLPRVLAVVGLLLATAAPASAAEADTTATVGRVLELTNAERAKVGLPPLVLSSELNAAAQQYSVVLATGGCFAHTCGAVPDMADRLGQAGYQGWTAIGENIAAGYPSPEAVVAGWMSSPGHRDNMLSSQYREIGIGVATGGVRFGTFWTQDFGARRVIPAAPAAEVPVLVTEPAPAAVEEMAPPLPSDEAPPPEDGAPPEGE